MSDANVLIRGGMVYDGTERAGIKADVYVKGERIVEIAPNLSVEDAMTIDASGCVVTPGFIDIHRHCDIAPFTNVDFGKLELAQGITSTIVGNCGLSPIPSNPINRSQVYDYIEPVVGFIPPSLGFEHYADYKEELKVLGIPIHMGFLAGAGAIRAAVKGFTRAPYTRDEMDRCVWYVKDAMEQGAFGLSLGIMYQPECYSALEDYVTLVRPVADRNGILCTHIRGEGDSLLESIAEVIELARRTGVRLNISHLKSTGIKNWKDKIWKAVDLIEKARSQGIEVTADFYPYTGGSTTLMSLIPPSVVWETVEKTVSFLSTADGKDKFKREIYKEHEGWDNMVTGIGWERILISSVHTKERFDCQGRNIAELAKEQGYDDAADFIVDLMISEEGKVGIIVLSMDLSDVEMIAGLPYTILISDALYGGGANPHPRLYGAFPKFLREMVLNKELMTLERGIAKMTALPAKRMGIRDRGIIAPQMYADLLVFSPEGFRDRADYQNSCLTAEGLDLAMISGAVVMKHGVMISRNSGRVLRF